MKEIINGKKYDTKTATWLAEVDNGETGLYYWCEALYRKRTGEYFIYGEGGPGSSYSRHVETNTWAGGWKIRPITEEEARKWVEEYANDQYEEIFGEVEE